MDGTPLNAHGSVLGFFLRQHCVRSETLARDIAQKQHLQMRMQRLVFNLPILQILQRPLLALQTGTLPDRRAGHRPWKPNDEIRSSVAGDKIGIKGILCRRTGDWIREQCAKDEELLATILPIVARAVLIGPQIRAVV